MARLAHLAAVGAFALAACQKSAPARRDSAVARASVDSVDDFGDRIVTGERTLPTRVVSLNPTTTELLFALGAGDRVVGRTHWDVYPPAARAVPDLGGGIRPNVEAVLAARPQLVVLYASGDNRAAAASLRAAGVRVIALKVDRITDFYRIARILGDAVGERPHADTIVDSVSRTLARVREITSGAPRPRVLWPLFADPMYVIGGGSFMSELVDVAGGTNVFGDAPQPSPQVGKEEVLRRNADVVIAAPSAVARMNADPTWRALKAVRDGRVYTEDTTLVERPSVKLGEAALSIALLLHPELRERLIAVSGGRQPRESGNPARR